MKELSNEIQLTRLNDKFNGLHSQNSQPSDKHIAPENLQSPKHHGTSLHGDTDHIRAKRSLDVVSTYEIDLYHLVFLKPFACSSRALCMNADARSVLPTNSA
jgi:hypothetical protein